MRDRRGTSLDEMTMADVVAVSHLMAGRLDAAAESLEQVRPGRAVADAYRPWIETELSLHRGDPEAAVRQARRAIAGLLRERRFVQLLVSLVLARALVRLDARAHATEIEATLARAEELLTFTGGRSAAPHLARARAEYAGAIGDDARRDGYLREAQKLFAEMGAEEAARTIRDPVEPA